MTTIEARKGNWCQTYSGGMWWPEDIRVGDFKIEDIAHGLALEPRFGSQSREPYCVGDHCLNVLEVVDRYGAAQLPAFGVAPSDEVRLAALAHDATEALMRDIPRPLKYSAAFNGYRAIEKQLHAAIFTQLGLPIDLPDIVKWADEVMLATERRDLMAPCAVDWELSEEPLVERVVPRTWAEVKRLWINEFIAIQRRRGRLDLGTLKVGEVAS